MKRFLVFAYDEYYPRGGFNDLVGDFDDLISANIRAEEKEREYRFTYIYVVDQELRKIVSVIRGEPYTFSL